MKKFPTILFALVIFAIAFLVSSSSFAAYPGKASAFLCQRMNSTGTALIFGNCLGSPFTFSPSGAGIVTQSGFNLVTQSGLNIIPHP